MNIVIAYLEKWPQRWVLTIMSMLGVTMAFAMRACLSIAMTQMVLPMTANVAGQNREPGICHAEVPQNLRGPTNGTHGAASPSLVGGDGGYRFNWDEETQGMVLSAFYYGYIVTHIPGGVLAQRIGGKLIMAYAIFSTSTLTILTPAIARFGPTHLMVLRFIEGLGEGMAFPALCTLLAQWSPPSEKGKLSAIVFAGVPIGNIIANLFSGLIINYVPGGWPNVFYIFGAISLFWLGLWLTIVGNNPNSHPFISDEEKNYLLDTIGSIERSKYLAPTPWKAIFSTPAVWALIIAEIGFDWAAYTIVNDLPKYMNDVLRFSIKQNGYLSAAPYLVQWIVSLVSNIAADFMINRRIATVTTIRKLYAIIGTIGPGLGVMSASFVGCDKILATLSFTLGMAAMGFCYPSIRVNALDLSSNYSATIMAVVNGLGCLSGMATPYVVGILTPNRTIFEWRLVFWIMLIVLISASTIFAVFGSGVRQSWDVVVTPSNSKTKSEKETKHRCKVTFLIDKA